jgi:hypothetical protein
MISIPSLNYILKPPVKILRLHSCPKIIAGGVPVTPINVVLERRRRLKNASDDSLDAYLRAGRLYAEYCAHMGRSVVDISNADFENFKSALLGYGLRDSNGNLIHLVGDRRRGHRTADLMLALLYSIAKDIEELYMCRFDWLRHDTVSHVAATSIRPQATSRSPASFVRTHRIQWTPAKVVAAPDDQFALMIDNARELWGNTVPDGDVAYAEDPEAQRDALFYRNVALLLLLRYEGCRRREPTFLGNVTLRSVTPLSFLPQPTPCRPCALH